jgi:hypothetical protein
MGGTIDALRISPKYSSRDWCALEQTEPDDWIRAAAIVWDRLEGRFLRFADGWLPDPFSGFIVLAIDSLLAETIQQFRTGETEGRGKSRRYVTQFLCGSRFQPCFDKNARLRFYEDIRCGLLHQAEAKEMWLVRRGQQMMLEQVAGAKGYIIDVQRFHAAVRLTFEDYCRDIKDPAQEELRANLWKKMEQISGVRTARGLLYEANPVNTSPPNISL